MDPEERKIVEDEIKKIVREKSKVMRDKIIGKYKDIIHDEVEKRLDHLKRIDEGNVDMKAKNTTIDPMKTRRLDLCSKANGHENGQEGSLFF